MFRATHLFGTHRVAPFGWHGFWSSPFGTFSCNQAPGVPLLPMGKRRSKLCRELSTLGSMDPWIYGPLDPSTLGSIDKGQSINEAVQSWIHIFLGFIDHWIHRTLDFGSIDPWIQLGPTYNEHYAFSLNKWGQLFFYVRTLALLQHQVFSTKHRNNRATHNDANNT